MNWCDRLVCLLIEQARCLPYPVVMSDLDVVCDPVVRSAPVVTRE
jgi:hypothetical protein